MSPAGSILSVMALFAVGAAPRGSAVDVFPERLVFEATVLRANPSAWKESPRFTRTRTIEIELRVDRVLKAKAAPPAEGKALTAVITETSKTMGRLEPGNAWGDADVHAGDAFLVFADEEDAASAFAQPTSVYPKQTAPALVEDVEWIAEGQKLDVPAQASRLLAVVGVAGKSPKDHTLFVGRYLAAVAHRATGPSRAQLLDAVAHVESIKLDESARAEALRTLYVGLLMQDTPPADEMQTLLAACLRTLASAPAPEAGEISARLESVVQVYLPWLAKHVAGFPSAAPPLVAKDQRERVKKTALSLAALERFPPQSRDVLRRLAGAFP